MTGAGDQASREELLERLMRDPARTAILTDIDGTIAAITSRPDETAVPESIRKALAGIAERFAMVACISGRRAVEAKELVGVEGIVYSGNHGMETLEPDSPDLKIDLKLRGHLDAVAGFVNELDPSGYESVGIWVEDKGPIQAFHWREVASERDAEAAAREVAGKALEAGLEPHWGRKILEIRPPGLSGKGDAISSLVNNRGLSLAVYAGDDRTDIDAFKRLRALVDVPGAIGSGLCVGIHSPEGPVDELREHSDFLLEGPESWTSILEELGR